jgi:hypothetical protein
MRPPQAGACLLSDSFILALLRHRELTLGFTYIYCVAYYNNRDLSEVEIQRIKVPP